MGKHLQALQEFLVYNRSHKDKRVFLASPDIKCIIPCKAFTQNILYIIAFIQRQTDEENSLSDEISELIIHSERVTHLKKLIQFCSLVESPDNPGYGLSYILKVKSGKFLIHMYLCDSVHWSTSDVGSYMGHPFLAETIIKRDLFGFKGFYLEL